MVISPLDLIAAGTSAAAADSVADAEPPRDDLMTIFELDSGDHKVELVLWPTTLLPRQLLLPLFILSCFRVGLAFGLDGFPRGLGVPSRVRR